MTHEFHYDSDLIGGSLQVRESRIIADLLLTQATEESWKQAILTDNILQKRSPATATRASRALRSRLERVEPAFWQAIRDGDAEIVIADVVPHGLRQQAAARLRLLSDNRLFGVAHAEPTAGGRQADRSRALRSRSCLGGAANGRGLLIADRAGGPMSFP